MGCSSSTTSTRRITCRGAIDSECGLRRAGPARLSTGTRNGSKVDWGEWHVAQQSPRVLEALPTIHPWKHQVEDNEVGSVISYDLQSLEAVASIKHRVARIIQQAGKHLTDRRLIFDEEHPSRQSPLLIRCGCVGGIVRVSHARSLTCPEHLVYCTLVQPDISG